MICHKFARLPSVRRLWCFGKAGLEVNPNPYLRTFCKIKTIDDERNPRFARIIRAFKEKTGSSVVINTSFNVRGEPIVCTPADAFRCFMHTNMDVLVLENFILLKQEQPEAREIDQDAYLAEFALD